MAQLNGDDGEYQRARRFYQMALRKCQQLLGKAHPLTTALHSALLSLAAPARFKAAE
ncbi:tetratricopeptide repeat protein [Ktedonosporobacter rubrisoli]|uniref:tetratricopeptide repeat protein n=1 Tax=Ktedonosporobacter rubrisoli TaxID=2509675 RepID=UPI003BF59587